MRINYSVRERRWLCWLAGARPVFACMQASSPSKPQADTVVMEGLGAEGLVERRIRRENMRSKKLPGGFCGAIDSAKSGLSDQCGGQHCTARHSCISHHPTLQLRAFESRLPASLAV